MTLRTARDPIARGAHGRPLLYLIALAGSIFSILLAPSAGLAQSVGGTTHAEFTLSHWEEVGGAGAVELTSSNPGQDDASAIQITGDIAGVHGNHDVLVRAAVEAQTNGAPRLKASGEHVFELTGSGGGDVWVSTRSTLLARATLIDDLTLSNLPVGATTVELYWDVHGYDDAEIDIDPPENLIYSFATTLRLESRGGASGPSTAGYEQLVPWTGGLLEQDLDDQKFVEEYAMTAFELGDGIFDLHIETDFEVEPFTSLLNEGTVQSLRAEGQHVAAFYDSADLVGVVIRDENGNILPNVIIIAASGYEYPVLGDVPSPPPPTKAILSPTAVLGTDLGEYNGDTLVDRMIDQSGLDKSFVSGVDDFDDYFGLGAPAWGRASYLNNWQSLVSFTLPLQGYVDFDLGGTYRIDRLAIWNLSLEDVTILVSDSPSGPWQEVGQFTLQSQLSAFSAFSAFSAYNSQTVDFGGEFEAHYVRIQVDSVHLYSPSDSWGYAIVGEVALSAESIPVPEPGTGLLLTAGVLGLGLLAKRGRGQGDTREA